MDYDYYNPEENSDFPSYDLRSSNRTPENLENQDKANNIINDHFKKYLMSKNPQLQSSIEMDSSQEEEINSKEDIIQSKTDEEIEGIANNKFRYSNPKSDLDFKNDNEKESNYDQNNYSEQNLQDNGKDINNKKGDKSNKITNNICIIINKPDVKDIENKNKNVHFDYTNTFGNGDEDNNKDNDIKNNKNDIMYQYSQKLIKNKSKRKLYTKLNKRKKNNSYINDKNRNKYSIDQNDDYGNHNYSYIEGDSDENGKKTTLHKKLNQKQKKLQDLERKIEYKTNVLNEKKSKANLKENNKHNKSTTLEREKKSKPDLRENKNKNRYITSENTKQYHRNINKVKEPSITNDSDYSYASERKKLLNMKNNNNYNNNINTKNNKNKKNNVYNMDTKSLNSEDKYFNDIPMTNIQTNKYIEQKVYRAVSPNVNSDKNNNLSFNRSIEQKRKLLGIPMNKNEYQRMNKKIENDLNEDERKNLKEKLNLFKKRQNEMLKNYEKKNIINQKSRENIKNANKSNHYSYNNNKQKSKSKTKTPIRIMYNNYPQSIYSNNTFDNENYNYNKENKNSSKLSNDRKPKVYKHNNSYCNNSYSVTNKNNKKSNNRSSYSQKPIIINSKTLKNSMEKNNNNTNYNKKKIKLLKNKEKDEDRIVTPTNYIRNNNRGQNELKRGLRENDSQKDNSYYSKVLTKLFNFSERNNNDKKNKKAPNKTYNINKNMNNTNSNKIYAQTKYTYNPGNDITKAKKLNYNYNNIFNTSSPVKTKILHSSIKDNEFMTLQSDENGKTLRIIKKRHKSPNNILQQILKTSYHMQNQNKPIEEKKIIKEKVPRKGGAKVGGKQYQNALPTTSRGISALRRINKRIENFKKRIHSRKRRRPRSKNPQFKSSSQLKKKFGRQAFGRVKENKSIRTLPDVNKDTYQNFDFIDDL